jgi:hypothetical protein
VEQTERLRSWVSPSWPWSFSFEAGFCAKTPRMNPCPSARTGVARGWAAARRGITRPKGREARAGLHNDPRSGRRKTGETRPPARLGALYPSPREGQSPLEKQKTGAPQVLAVSFARGIEAGWPRRDGGSVHEISYAAGWSAPIGTSDSLT